MMVASIDVVNYALELVAAQTVITALSDGTIAGNAAGVIYAPTVQMLLRQLDPDFARYTISLVLAGGVAVPTPWTFAYLYPTDCLRARQVAPPPGGYNVFDPQPIRANVGFAFPGSVATKIIATNQASAQLVYTTSLVTENQWDAIFLQAVIRQLANPLSMAIAGRPDFARELLDEAARYEQMAELADESMARAA
jgi:hypothetical protein